MALWMRWRVWVVDGDGDGKEVESGLVMVGVVVSMVDEEEFLSSLEEPPKKPPNAMIVVIQSGWWSRSDDCVAVVELLVSVITSKVHGLRQ